MRILVIGAGGVGSAVVPIAVRRSFFEHLVIADYDLGRARGAAERAADARVSAAQIDASSADAGSLRSPAKTDDPRTECHRPAASCRQSSPGRSRGADYLDMAMSLSEPHPTRPHEETGEAGRRPVRAGAATGACRPPRARRHGRRAGALRRVRYAADHLFSEIDELGTRDGANLVVRDEAGNEIFAPSFTIWTTIEECLNPPVIWEKDRGWFTTPPFSEPETFVFPRIGPVECVNVEHEEVLLMPRWLDARRVTFKYGLGDDFIGVLKTPFTSSASIEPKKVRD